MKNKDPMAEARKDPKFQEKVTKNKVYKFRAWDKKDKAMYYNIQKGIKFTDLSHYTFDEFLGNPKGMGDYHEWEVMQFTGLKDKNKKDAYFGDIVKYRDEAGVEQIGIIKDYGYLSCYIEAIGGDEEGNQDLQLHPDNKFEIIGNKWENDDFYFLR